MDTNGDPSMKLIGSSKRKISLVQSLIEAAGINYVIVDLTTLTKEGKAVLTSINGCIDCRNINEPLISNLINEFSTRSIWSLLNDPL